MNQMSSDTKYNANIQRVRELLGHAGRQHEVLLSKSLFGLLGCALRSIKGCSDSTLLANSNMAVLDDICSGKFVVLSRLLQNVVCNIYTDIFQSVPGYAVRNTISNLLVSCGNKATSATGRECSTSVLGHILQKRAVDCASMLTEVVVYLTKQIKTYDSCRLATIKALTFIILGGKGKIQDLHGEIIRTSTKYAADKNTDVRLAVAVLLTALAEASGVPPAVALASTGDKIAGTAIDLISTSFKFLDDSDVVVQSTYAACLARVLVVQMQGHSEALEVLKIGQNRGGAEEPKKKDAPNNGGGKFSTKLSTAFTAAVSSSGRKLIEDYTLPTILAFFLKQVTIKVALRGPLIASLTYLFADISQDLSGSELTSIVIASLHLLQEPSMTGWTHDEIVFFRARVSLLIRTGITTALAEARKLFFVGILVSCLTGEGNASLIQRNEHQVLVILNEIAHCLRLLREASVGVCEEVQGAAIQYLGNASFGVRTAASCALSAIASTVTGLAAQLLRHALLDARAQVIILLKDGDENPPSNTNVTTGSANSKAERLTSMYQFHGMALFISTLLRTTGQTVPTCLPRYMVLEALCLGLDLLRADVLRAAPSSRSVVCSVVRAGSLITSSCMNVGYAVLQEKVIETFITCDSILKGTLAVVNFASDENSYKYNDGVRQMQTGSRDFNKHGPVVASEAISEKNEREDKEKDLKDTRSTSPDDNLLYELMTVEAALVSISSLLWFCPEALTQEDHCLGLVVSGLEIAFRAVKLKYQPKFRSHFRFRTLHAILLECFTWLPSGVFPNCCQQVFIEALRVFRDSISSGFACTNMHISIHPHQAVLDPSYYITQSPKLHLNSLYGGCGGSPSCDVLYMLRLEHLSACLQKKETEASLVCFGGKDSWGTPCHLSQHDSASPLRMSVLDPQFHFSSQGMRTSHSFLEEKGRNRQNIGNSNNNRWFPSAIEIDSRTISAAIGLLSTTFVNQTPEYQTKTCILCAQAIEQFSLKAAKDSYSAISSSLFGSDEERKKREKRAYNANKNVVCAFNAIIAGFPTHNGATLDLDLNWGQLVVDTLFDMVTCAFCDIRIAACNGLATFASKLPASGLIDILTERISSALSLALDRHNKKNDGDCHTELSGYLILLAELFMVSPSRPDTRLHIMATIFNCIRKVDVSMSFRAHAFNAMSVIFKDVAVLVGGGGKDSPDRNGLAQSPSTTSASHALEALSATSDMAAFRAFLDKIWHSLDVHAVSIQTSGEDPEMLLVSLLRLVSAATPLTLSNIPSSAFVDHLLLTFDAIRCAAFSPAPPLQEEALVMLQLFPAKKHLGTILHVLIDCLVKHTYSTSTRSGGLLTSNLSISVSSFSHTTLKQALLPIEALAMSHPSECVSAGLDVVLFHLLNWAAGHPTFSFDLLPSLENRRFDPPVDTIPLVLHLINILAREDCLADPDRRTGRWLLLLRNLSTGIALAEARDTVEMSAEVDGEAGFYSDVGRGNASSKTQDTITTYQQFVVHCKEAAASRLLNICGSIRRIGSEGTALTSMFANIGTRISSSDNAIVVSSGLLVPTSAIKIAAISLAASLLSTSIIHCSGRPHLDISKSRQLTNDALYVHDASLGSYASVPLYVSMLLHDLVSMGVTTATFSINDRVLPSLHLEAARMLETLVILFGSTADPDAIRGAEFEPNRLAVFVGGALFQYSSQMLAAIRPGLQSPSVDLRFVCCRVLCVMLEKGLCNDEVMARRLLGGIVGASTNESFATLRAGMRSDCNETSSTVDFYVTHIILARLVLMARSNCNQNTHATNGISASICAMIITQLEPTLQLVRKVWHGMSIDAVRYLQQKSGSASSTLLSTATPSPWPKETSQTAGIRGGITHLPAIDRTNVKQYLVYALPFTLAASTITKSIHPKGNGFARLSVDDVDVFTIACGLLDHDSMILCNDTNGTSYVDVEGRGEVQLLALRSLEALDFIFEVEGTHSFSSGVATEGAPSLIPTKDCTSPQRWVSVVRHLSSRILSFIVPERDRTNLLIVGNLLCHLACELEIFDQQDTKMDDESNGGLGRPSATLHEELLRASLLALSLSLPEMFMFSDSRNWTDAILSGSRPIVVPVVASDCLGCIFSPDRAPVLDGLFKALAHLFLCDCCNADRCLLQKVMCRLLPVLVMSGTVNIGGLIDLIVKVLTNTLCDSGVSSIPQMLITELLAWKNEAGEGTYKFVVSTMLGVIARIAGGELNNKFENLELFAPLCRELLLQETQSLSVFARSFLECILRFLNEDVGTDATPPSVTAVLGQTLLAAIYPAVLLLLRGQRLNNDDFGEDNWDAAEQMVYSFPKACLFDDASTVLLLQVVYLGYKVSSAKDFFLPTVLSPFCDYLLMAAGLPGFANPDSYRFLGQALTKIAVLYPQHFKEHILNLEIEQRNCLQNCLRSASAGHNSDTSSAVGRIDVSRFRKR